MPKKRLRLAVTNLITERVVIHDATLMRGWWVTKCGASYSKASHYITEATEAHSKNKLCHVCFPWEDRK